MDIKKKQIFSLPLKYYGVILKDHTKLMESQSGGAFCALAEYFLNRGGIVYGCGLDKDNDACYMRITSIDELYTIKGSKYVQSNLGDTFNLVKEDLSNGKLVLFSGTPCYCLGVKNFASNLQNYNNLYTVDIICHGVPSPLVYKKYRDELEMRNHKKISRFIFRVKNRGGWSIHMEKIVYEDNSEEIRDDYTKLFYTNLPLRPSCGKCRFSTMKRATDFTIGDFWGVKQRYPDFYNPDGVSILFCNNQRSIEMFNEIRSQFDVIETDSCNAIQPNLVHSSKIPKCNKLFWWGFKKNGFYNSANLWVEIIDLKNNLIISLKQFVKSILRTRK